MSKLTYRLLQQDVNPDDFDCGIDSINEYVYCSYLATLLQHGYAYQIEYKNKIIGYYMITINHILLEDCNDEIADYTSGLSNYIYSIEIKYLAIHRNYQRKGIGTEVLKSIIKGIKDFLYRIPFRLITIDARNDYIQWYKRFGFIECSKNSIGQEGYTTRMYLDCLQHEEELKKYEMMQI